MIAEKQCDARLTKNMQNMKAWSLDGLILFPTTFRHIFETYFQLFDFERNLFFEVFLKTCFIFEVFFKKNLFRRSGLFPGLCVTCFFFVLENRLCNNSRAHKKFDRPNTNSQSSLSIISLAFINLCSVKWKSDTIVGREFFGKPPLPPHWL